MKIIQESQDYRYITFDSYYNVDNYNNFLTAARNNKIKYEEFLSIKPHHNRYLKINKADLPTFIDYDIAGSSEINWLVSIVKPVRPNEAYKLKRRPGQDISYFNYILPNPLKDMHEEDYVYIFKAWDMTELAEISSKLGKKTKIYKWGKAILKGYNIYVCFNSYIKGYLKDSRILLEYSNESKGNKVPKKEGFIEYELNHKVLVQEKLVNKTLELEYYINGKKVPLKKSTFI